MASTFMGLETSKRGLFTQQSALYTTGHNIANANTEGYSRQRVNLQSTIPYPGMGLNEGKTAGQIGTGVEIGSVERMRDDFIDRQYRQETSKLGYWEAQSQAISEMEDVFNEPSEYGLSKALNDFTGALQDLTVNPENGGARSVVVQRGIAVADSFNYMHTSITQLKENAGTEIGVLLKDTNSIIQQIASLNEQIEAVEPNGYIPNDLYDTRDKLIDELSTYLPIDTFSPNANGLKEGAITISLRLKGTTTPVNLVDGKNYNQLRTSGATKEDNMTPDGMVEGFEIVKVNEDGSVENAGTTYDINQFSDVGKLKSLVNSYGYKIPNPDTTDTENPFIEKGLYADMIAKLDLLAKSFATTFNDIHVGRRNHAGGTDMEGNKGELFFVQKGTLADGDITAENIYVSQTIINNPDKIAASDSPKGEAEPGNGKQAQKLADLKSEFLAALDGNSVQTYFEGLIGQLGVDGIQANRLQHNSETLQQSVLERRASVSSVSLDEEMTNMITFQQAYNANARMISVIDEMLDKVINGMGRAGL